jgi:hypothetical protein
MNAFWDSVTKIASLAAVLGAVVSVIWFVASLDQRIRVLEGQVHFLATSPSIAQSGSTTPSGNKSAEGGAALGPSPLQQTCADLATRAAKAVETGSPVTVAQPLEELMHALGCGTLGTPAK